MITRSQIIALLKEQYPYLSAEYGVRRIALFGSHARGSANEASDVDLLVEFDRPPGFAFMELTEYLEMLLGCKVDVLTPAGLRNIRARHIAESIARSVEYV